MKHSLTNRALGVGGDSNTTSVTVRLPSEVVDYIDSHFNGRIKNRSEFLQHWAQLGKAVTENPEIEDALWWALEEAEKEAHPLATIERDPAGGELIAPVLGHETWGEAANEQPDSAPPDAFRWAHDLPLAAEIRDDAVAAATGVTVRTGDAELDVIYSDMLEAMRNRVH